MVIAIQYKEKVQFAIDMWSRVGGYRCPCPQLLRTFPRQRGNFNLFNLIYIYPSERISEADLISPDITLQHDRVLSLKKIVVFFSLGINQFM